jgi:hypothetical protein
VGTIRAKNFVQISVVYRIADGCAYRLDLQSLVNLHPSFHVSLLDCYVHDNKASRIRPAPIPDLFAEAHEECEVSAIGSHRWWASHMQYIFSWVEFAEDEKS